MDWLMSIDLFGSYLLHVPIRVEHRKEFHLHQFEYSSSEINQMKNWFFSIEFDTYLIDFLLDWTMKKTYSQSEWRDFLSLPVLFVMFIRFLFKKKKDQLTFFSFRMHIILIGKLQAYSRHERRISLNLI